MPDPSLFAIGNAGAAPAARIMDDPRYQPIVDRLRRAGFDDFAIESALREEQRRSPSSAQALPTPTGPAPATPQPWNQGRGGPASLPPAAGDPGRTAGVGPNLMDTVKQWYQAIQRDAGAETEAPQFPRRLTGPGQQFPRRRPEPAPFEGPMTPGPVQVPSAQPAGPAPYAPIPNPRAVGPGLETRELLPPMRPGAMPAAAAGAPAAAAPAGAPPLPPTKPAQTAILPPAAQTPPAPAAAAPEAGGMNPFLQALAAGGSEQDAYMNLMNFGLNLMASSEAQPGSTRGPSLFGAVGEAGKTSMAQMKADKAGRAKVKSEQAAAQREERRHQENLDLKRRQIELQSVRIAQGEETKRLMMQIDRDNKTLDRELKQQALTLDTYAAVADIRAEYAARRQEMMLDPALAGDKEALDASLRSNLAEERNVISNILGGRAAGTAAPTEAPETAAMPEMEAQLGGQSYQKIGGRWFMTGGGS